MLKSKTFAVNNIGIFLRQKQPAEFNTMHGAKTKLIEISAEQAFLWRVVTLSGILGISFHKSFRCFRNSQTEIESSHSVSNFKGIHFMISCISFL